MTARATLTCQQVVELVTGYLDGGLDPRTAMLVRAHLATCPGCHAYVEQIRQTISLLGTVTPDNLSQTTRDGLMIAFRDLYPPRG